MNKVTKNAKAFAQQKRHRRQWIAFVRMCRYGVSNFTRNIWLTVAATVVMTITLLIIFTTVAARNVLSDTVAMIGDGIDMSIYLKGDTKNSDAELIASDLRKLSNVKQVNYIDAEKNRENFAQENKSDIQMLDALNTANNKFFGTLRVNLIDVNDTSQLDDFVKTNDRYKEHADPDREPSFAGVRQESIKSLARATVFAQNLGIGASILFIVISSLIVFNTIRMAIFNRKDEIEMMKLIGADKGFIRGPFVVEAMVYGLFAGIVATAIGALVVNLVAPALDNYGVAIQPTISFLTTYMPFVALAMIVLGSLIGAISSLLATRRYLKI